MLLPTLEFLSDPKNDEDLKPLIDALITVQEKLREHFAISIDEIDFNSAISQKILDKILELLETIKKSSSALSYPKQKMILFIAFLPPSLIALLLELKIKLFAISHTFGIAMTSAVYKIYGQRIKLTRCEEEKKPPMLPPVILAKSTLVGQQNNPQELTRQAMSRIIQDTYTNQKTRENMKRGIAVHISHLSRITRVRSSKAHIITGPSSPSIFLAQHHECLSPIRSPLARPSVLQSMSKLELSTVSYTNSPMRSPIRPSTLFSSSPSKASSGQSTPTLKAKLASLLENLQERTRVVESMANSIKVRAQSAPRSRPTLDDRIKASAEKKRQKQVQIAVETQRSSPPFCESSKAQHPSAPPLPHLIVPPSPMFRGGSTRTPRSPGPSILVSRGGEAHTPISASSSTVFATTVDGESAPLNDEIKRIEYIKLGELRKILEAYEVEREAAKVGKNYAVDVKTIHDEIEKLNAKIKQKREVTKAKSSKEEHQQVLQSMPHIVAQLTRLVIHDYPSLGKDDEYLIEMGRIRKCIQVFDRKAIQFNSDYDDLPSWEEGSFKVEDAIFSGLPEDFEPRTPLDHLIVKLHQHFQQPAPQRTSSPSPS